MMSRTSPYLRKVAADNILCKFKLTTDGRMSPITQKKLKTIVDDQRNENSDPNWGRILEMIYPGTEKFIGKDTVQLDSEQLQLEGGENQRS